MSFASTSGPALQLEARTDSDLRHFPIVLVKPRQIPTIRFNRNTSVDIVDLTLLLNPQGDKRPPSYLFKHPNAYITAT